jgi:hypothetical protein
MNEGKQQTSFEEAVSTICIASAPVGLGFYLAAIDNVPLV